MGIGSVSGVSSYNPYDYYIDPASDTSSAADFAEVAADEMNTDDYGRIADVASIQTEAPKAYAGRVEAPEESGAFNRDSMRRSASEVEADMREIQQQMWGFSIRRVSDIPLVLSAG